MNPPNLSLAATAVPQIRVRHVILGLLGAFIFLALVGVVGLFFLSSDAGALKQSVVQSVPGACDKRIALSIGGITTGLVRAGSRCFQLDPEPRAALEALHGLEVGVYHLRQVPNCLVLASVLAHADKSMSARGWDRAVGVISERQLVAVYVPRRGASLRNVKCCVAVMSGSDLVVGSVRGNVQPLLALAAARMDLHEAVHHLALK